MNLLWMVLKGMAMGIAEVIPGVSGGTIAFITGIYEKLLHTIKAFGPEAIQAFRKEGISGFWSAINGTFLVALLFGMGIGIGIGVFGVTHLMESFPEVLWAFFFGLIIASAIYIGKQVSRWSVPEYLLLSLGAIFAFYITTISPANGNESLWFVFLSGAIAISALILPGISGSFILLLMGMYTFVIPTVKDALTTFNPDSLVILAVFGAGCLTGLVLFSRVLSWTFENHKSKTLALLTGFMIGSLNKIWPWRNPTEWLQDDAGNMILNSKGLQKVIKEENIAPWNYEIVTQQDPMIIASIIAAILGFGLVFLLERLGTNKE